MTSRRDPGGRCLRLGRYRQREFSTYSIYRFELGRGEDFDQYHALTTASSISGERE